MFSSCWIFFPKALTIAIIPEPTVNQIHKLSLSEGERGDDLHTKRVHVK